MARVAEFRSNMAKFSSLTLRHIYLQPSGVEASIVKFLEAAKSLEADFLRKQTYSRVNHPQEVTKEVNYPVSSGQVTKNFIEVFVTG